MNNTTPLLAKNNQNPEIQCGKKTFLSGLISQQPDNVLGGDSRENTLSFSSPAHASYVAIFHPFLLQWLLCYLLFYNCQISASLIKLLDHISNSKEYLQFKILSFIILLGLRSIFIWFHYLSCSSCFSFPVLLNDCGGVFLLLSPLEGACFCFSPKSE